MHFGANLVSDPPSLDGYYNNVIGTLLFYGREDGLLTKVKVNSEIKIS